MDRTSPYNFTSFYILSITYYAYNRYFLKNKISNEIYGADEKACQPSFEPLSKFGGGTLHKYLTWFFS